MMLYSEADKKATKAQLTRRILMMVFLAILPNIAAAVIMYTVRIQWLSLLLGCLGGALAIFYWGLCCYPVYAYLRYVRDILEGRNHVFSGTLKAMAQDSVREGVPCKTMYFADDAGDEERLCYFDLQKYPQQGFAQGQRYVVSVHGQAIISMQPE